METTYTNIEAEVVIAHATGYAFIFDAGEAGVVLSGPAGVITIYEDGAVFSGAPECVEPCYTDRAALWLAKLDATSYLRRGGGVITPA